MNLTVIRKRNGKIVPFDSTKITEAVSKAFLAITGKPEPEIPENIKNLAVEKIDNIYKENESSIPYVEQVQDVVEQAIMDAGHFEIAKHYILYRHERAIERAKEKEEERKRAEDGAILITAKNGRQERFNEGVLRSFISKMSEGYTSVSIEAVVDRVKNEIYDGITADEFLKAVVLSCRSMIEIDPDYSYVAARMIRYIAIKEMGIEISYDTYTEEKISQIYKDVLVKSIKQGVEDKVYDKRMESYDLEKLANAIDQKRDYLFQYLGMQVVYDRYLVRDLERGNALLELPQIFWMRVAMGLALLETNKEDKAIEFYNAMSNFKIVPSTPTLFQSGLVYSQLSSCFLNTVDDDLKHIFKVYGDNAQMSKYSGGVATDWSYIRSTGSIVKKTRIESNGLIPFLKIANDVTVTINRSGRRRGAVCSYLESWHYDVEEFLELRKNTGDERRRTPDMNIANWVPDLFMERVRNDEDWTLFSPDEVPELHEVYGKKFREMYVAYEAKAGRGDMRIFKKMKAKELYRKMIMMLYETGHPWMTFKDPSNIRSPQDHDGVVHCSNLCTEITLNNNFEETAVCNLASVNLPKHFVNGKMDLEMLKNTVKTGMRMLDNTVEINFYPTEEAKTSNFKHRAVGLGIMGFHDALYELGIAFDSPQALVFADQNQEFISYHAIMSSSEMALERGAYETFKGSKWDRNMMPVDTLDLLESERGLKINVPRGGAMDWTPVREHIKQHGMRNSNCMAIAPTATISNVVGSSPCIEPYYKNIYVKSNMSGEFTNVNDYLVNDLKKIGLWDTDMLMEIKMAEGSVQEIMRIPEGLRNRYKETFEIHYKTLIDLAAYRGKWIDQSQSLNLYYKGNSGKEIGEMYMYAWEMGLKTTYYLRTLAASGIEKATTSIDKKEEEKPIETVVPVKDIPTNMSMPAYQNIATYAQVQNEMDNKEKITEKVLANTDTEKTILVGGKEVKICKILDPDCEACQ